MKKIFSFAAAMIAAMSMSAQDPIAVTCAEAAAAMPAQSGSETEEVYIVTGYITNTNGNISKGQQTFYMDDAKGSKKTLQGYWCNLPAEEVEANKPLNVGDKITLTGKIMNYNNTPEIKNGDVAILDRAANYIDTIDISVCKAIEIGSALNDLDYSADAYRVYGRLKGQDQVNSTYGLHTFDMACGEQIFKAYNCKGVEGLELGKGDSVIVIGKLYNYRGTIEISNGTVELIEKSTEGDVIYQVNVTEAVNIAMSLENGKTTDDRYAVTGYVDSIATAFSEQYQNISFFMTDDMADPAYNFEAFRVKCTAEEAEKIVVGAKVTVTAALQHYYKAATEEADAIDLVETVAGGTVKILEKAPSSTDIVPSDAVLAKYYEQGQVCACFFVPAKIACNDIVITGSFNSFRPDNGVIPVEPIEGYDGWYVASWEPEAEPDAEKGIQAKPVMLDGEGKFSWEYQVGAATAIRGGVQVVQGAYADEIDLINYGADAPNVFTIDAWKNNPCTSSYYTLSVTCDNSEGRVTGNGRYVWGSNVTIYAYPYEGYHFTQWSDGNTENPRTIVVNQNISLSAEFARHPLPHINYDSNKGRAWYRAWHDSIPEYKNNYELYDIFAEPNYGYHFDKWSDGNTQAWRTVRITCDTVFTAFFEPDMFEIKTKSNNPQYGKTYGDTIVQYGETIEIKAIPNYGYEFSYWDLGTDKPSWEDSTSIQPTYIVVKENRVCTAYFYPKSFYVVCNSEDKNMGTAVVDGYNWHHYLETVTIEAIPNYGYHFTQWSDGNTQNPRQFTLTQDTAFMAQFAIDRSGFCGKNNVLRWEYDTLGRTLTISGNGALQENYTFGVEAPQYVEKLIIAEGVTAIGNNAFDGYATIEHICLPSTVKTIYEQAFYNCTGLHEIYAYRDRPSVAYSNTFDGIDKFDCTLHVLAASIDMYKAATGWRDFFYIESIDAQGVTETITEVETVPTDNTVEITWPVSEDAEKYTIEITKDGVVFCTLIFNANGQLLGIAFAPGRNGQSNAPAAVRTANGGLRFTVTGLNSGTEYQMTVVATNAEEEVIANYTSEFTTTANADVYTSIDNTSADSQSVTKLLRDGQLLILRGDHTYTLQGQEVR